MSLYDFPLSRYDLTTSSLRFDSDFTLSLTPQTLRRSLSAMLEYDGEDLEQTFLQTFQVGYTDGGGAQRSYELVPAGRHRAVNRHNVKVSPHAGCQRTSTNVNVCQRLSTG